MILLIGGTALVAASLFYLAFKLRVAYSVGESPENAGGVPTLDGVLFPPAFCAHGVWLIAIEWDELRVSGWIAVVIWLVLTAAAVAAMSAATAAGRRKARSRITFEDRPDPD